jgi:SAM-dependent methyltransferase
LVEEPDVAPTALDNAPGLVRQLKALAAAHGLPAESVIEGEMRDLSSLSSATFHCVRNHASLHHLPVIAPGYGADVAIAESRRILVAGGVLYVLVRAGEGLTVIDTREGLGSRVFQLFSPELLASLVERHRFRVLRVEALDSKRGGGAIRWIFCLAVSA